MSKHFYSFQYDMPYRPTYLRNWEVPKFYCPKPRRRIGSTKIISNNRGQLLPGVPRPPCNPFGDFVGTWQMPKKITRERANQLNGLADKVAFMEKCRQLASIVPKKRCFKVLLLEPQPVKTILEQPATSTDPDKHSDEIRKQEEEEERTNTNRIICPIHDF